ncbi:hypothetical protein GXB85_12965 [Cellulomonas sp. APG4]|uniref:hypothetical protein n=1 Tax=Cellulomonas sp. APG4 TaxID=1538656 RepID=UPI0013799D8A|nr:hypothetical protein [Cellulomonas sp. APG4]NCT91855.1 hypothetical protein [Cellulomonas sp. APG4]
MTAGEPDSPVAPDLLDHLDFTAGELALPAEAVEHFDQDAVDAAPQAILDTFTALLETSRVTQNGDPRTLEEYEPVKPLLTADMWDELVAAFEEGNTASVAALVPSSALGGDSEGASDEGASDGAEAGENTVERVNPYRRNGTPAIEVVTNDDTGESGVKVVFPYVRSFDRPGGELYESGWAQSLWFVHTDGRWLIDHWYAEPTDLA